MKEKKDNIIMHRVKSIFEEIKENQKKTNRDIAKDLKISYQDVTNYTNTRIPSLKFLIKVSQTYNISLDYLVGLSDNKISESFNLFNDCKFNSNVISNLKKIKNELRNSNDNEIMYIINAINLILGQNNMNLLLMVGVYLSLYNDNNIKSIDKTIKEVEIWKEFISLINNDYLENELLNLFNT